MALDNTLVYRVFGPALVQVGTGANNALETLGYTENGVTMSETYHLEPIMTDAMGPKMPAEYQKFGVEYRLSKPLIVWNPTIWDKVQKRMGNTNTAGALTAAGALVYTNSLTFRVAVTSADTLEDPFYFPFAILRGDANRKLASKHGPLTVSILAHAMHLATETSVAGKVSMQRALP
jgi:hypothetical protein